MKITTDVILAHTASPESAAFGAASPMGTRSA
jgi:hypothetical protein